MQAQAVAGVPWLLLLLPGRLERVHGTRQSSAADLMDDVNVLTPCRPVGLITALCLLYRLMPSSIVESTTCTLPRAIIFNAASMQWRGHVDWAYER